jgi:hypothetical protein
MDVIAFVPDLRFGEVKVVEGKYDGENFVINFQFKDPNPATLNGVLIASDNAGEEGPPIHASGVLGSTSLRDCRGVCGSTRKIARILTYFKSEVLPEQLPSGVEYHASAVRVKIFFPDSLVSLAENLRVFLDNRPINFRIEHLSEHRYWELYTEVVCSNRILRVTGLARLSPESKVRFSYAIPLIVCGAILAVLFWRKFWR